MQQTSEWFSEIELDKIIEEVIETELKHYEILEDGCEVLNRFSMHELISTIAYKAKNKIVDTYNGLWDHEECEADDD